MHRISYSLIILKILLLSLQLHGQKTTKKDVELRLKKEFWIVHDSVTFYMKRDLKKAKLFALENLNFAKKTEKPKWIARANCNYGVVLSEIGGENNWIEAKKFLNESIIQFSKIQDSTSIIFTKNVLSSIHLKTKNYPKALSLSLENLEQIKASIKDKKDSITLGVSYGNLALIYENIKRPDSAIANYANALNIFKKHRTDLQSPCLLGIANAYLSKKDWEKAMVYYKKTEDFNKSAQLKSDMSILYTNMALTYAHLDLPKKALEYGWQAVRHTDTVEKNQYYKIAMSKIPTFYAQLKIADSTLYYADQILDDLGGNGDLTLLLNVLQSKVEALETLQKTNETIPILKRINRLKDSIEALENKTEITNVLLKNKDEKMALKETVFNQRFTANKKIIYICLISIIILIILIIVIKRYNLKQINSFRTKEHYSKELLNNIKYERDHLNRQIATSKVNLAVKHDLLQKVKFILDQTNKQELPKDIKTEINTTLLDIENNIELNKLWYDFFKHFEEVHPDFIQKLSTNYNLSPNDLKICAFIKMNLSNKEIAQLLNIHLNSVHTILYRLKKKLDLPKDQSVFNFLQFYEHN